MRKLQNKELNRLDVDQFREAEKTPLVLVLENIRSMHNIGSVFRTADAFLLQKIYLCGITATPPHKDIRKTALGATESVEWEYHNDAIALLQELKEDHQCMAVEQAVGATPLNSFLPTSKKPYVFVLGNEVKGVSQEAVNLCHGVLEIPQLGTKHSLNIAVSAGIVVWDFWCKTNS
ncbi:RNA methyltransferase [Muriicola sp.]|uniref:RNA methyltransferase n=1 Tax=Muriicola sp. TaxID=2020856 RepID=UPI003C795B89